MKKLEFLIPSNEPDGGFIQIVPSDINKVQLTQAGWVLPGCVIGNTLITDTVVLPVSTISFIHTDNAENFYQKFYY